MVSGFTQRAMEKNNTSDQQNKSFHETNTGYPSPNDQERHI